MFKSYWRWVVRAVGATVALAKRHSPVGLTIFVSGSFVCGFFAHWYLIGFDAAKEELTIGVVYGVIGPFLLSGAIFLYYLFRAPVDEMRELKEQLTAAENSASPAAVRQQPTDQERFGKLAHSIRACLSDVTAYLDAHNDRVAEHRDSHFDYFLRRDTYRKLRVRLRSLCDEKLSFLGIEGRPKLPGPHYPTHKLAEWQGYLDQLYKFSVRDKLDEAIKFAQDEHLTNRSDDG